MNRGVPRRGWAARIQLFLPFALLFLAGCESSGGVTGGGPAPAAPVGLTGFYYDRAVYLEWALGPGWNGESFRIYGKRVSDPNYFLIAEVTNCSAGACSYRDVNIVANATYNYYVASVGSGGTQAASANTLQIQVPAPTPPPVPGGLRAIALDRGVFLAWNTASRAADDFAFYRIYFDDGTTAFPLGETDSEGFLDLLVQNGSSYAYFVTAVDDRGHESQGSALAIGTPRPDFHGELLVAFEDLPGQSGFRFVENADTENPVVSGTDGTRHFRLEVDAGQFWLVPAPGVQIHPTAVFTTALRCGPRADPGCIEVDAAPATGYAALEIELVPEFSYVVRVPAGGSNWRYGVLRVSHVGVGNQGSVVIFDWAFQLQPNNRTLAPSAP